MSESQACMGGCCMANPYPAGHCCYPENGCCVVNVWGPLPIHDVNIMNFSTHGLTIDELQILQNLKDAWDNFVKLDPKMDADFTREFNDGIHRCQQIIALRVAQRVDPLVWRQSE